jgi:hypothetical protein
MDRRQSHQWERIDMPFKVQIGPPQISIHHGQTVLISDPDEQIIGQA